MKRIITVVMLVAVLLVGAMTMDAKTTKKKSSAKSSTSSSALSLSTFFTVNRYGGTKLYSFKSPSAISKALKNMGFTYTGEEDGGYDEDEYDEDVSYPMIMDCYQKGNTEIMVYQLEDSDYVRYIGVRFGSSSEKTAFKRTLNVKGSNLYNYDEEGLMIFGAYEN